MKFLLPLFITTFLWIHTSYSQVFSWKTNDSTEVVSTDGFGYLILNMTNTTGDSLLLDWKLLKNTFQSSWDITLCDYNTCYIGVPDSGSMAKIADGEDGLIALTVLAGGTAAVGEMRFYIYDENNPGIGDTATFILDASQLSTGIEQNIEKQELTLYPNPATDQINISGLSNGSATIWVLDLNGKQVIKESINVKNNGEISLLELPKGVYILKVLNGDNRLTYNRIIKN